MVSFASPPDRSIEQSAAPASYVDGNIAVKMNTRGRGRPKIARQPRQHAGMMRPPGSPRRGDGGAKVRGCIESVLYNPLVWGSLALALLGIALFLFIDVVRGDRHANNIARLPWFDVAQPGQLAVVEGQISEDSPLVRAPFVAYVREVYRSCGRSSCWIEDSRQTPALVVDVERGAVQILNTDYRFESTDVTVREAEPTFSTGAIQLRGFGLQSRVVAVGTVVQQGDGRALDADFLAAGTREQYTEGLRIAASEGLWLSGVFLVVGLGVLRVTVRQVRRFLREEGIVVPPPMP
jgi:hypothetical protein